MERNMILPAEFFPFFPAKRVIRSIQNDLFDGRYIRITPNFFRQDVIGNNEGPVADVRFIFLTDDLDGILVCPDKMGREETGFVKKRGSSSCR